jgi:hypothetical protein
LGRISGSYLDSTLGDLYEQHFGQILSGNGGIRVSASASVSIANDRMRVSAFSVKTVRTIDMKTHCDWLEIAQRLSA